VNYRQLTQVASGASSEVIPPASHSLASLPGQVPCARFLRFAPPGRLAPRPNACIDQPSPGEALPGDVKGRGWFHPCGASSISPLSPNAEASQPTVSRHRIRESGGGGTPARANGGDHGATVTGYPPTLPRCAAFRTRLENVGPQRKLRSSDCRKPNATTLAAGADGTSNHLARSAA
jgi:hypothetical protein